MRILIVYASNSGSTYLTGSLIRDQLASNSHDVTFVKAALANVDDVDEHDILLLGTPSWWANGKEGQMQETMQEFTQKIKQNKADELNGKSVAFFGCGDSTYLEFCGGVDNLEKFGAEVQAKLILPSLKIDSFYFEQEKNTQLIQDWTNKLINKLGVVSIA